MYTDERVGSIPSQKAEGGDNMFVWVDNNQFWFVYNVVLDGSTGQRIHFTGYLVSIIEVILPSEVENQPTRFRYIA